MNIISLSKKSAPSGCNTDRKEIGVLESLGFFWTDRYIELSPNTKTALKVALLIVAMPLLLLGVVTGATSAVWFTHLICIVNTMQKLESKTCNYDGEQKARITKGVADPLFFLHLFSDRNVKGGGVGAPLAIIADFFEKSGRADEKYTKELKQAFDRTLRLRFYSSQREAEKIVESVERGDNQLLALSCCIRGEKGTHGIGVRFSKDPKSDNIICSIFNSGYGQKYHDVGCKEEDFRAEFISGEIRGELSPLVKTDLEYRVSIPAKNFTPKNIQMLMDPASTVEDIYETMTGLGTRVHLGDKDQKRIQRPQKAKNCSQEWIYAYLKYQMEELDYYEMRAELCRASLEAVKAESENSGTSPFTQAIYDRATRSVSKKIARVVTPQLYMIVQRDPWLKKLHEWKDIKKDRLNDYSFLDKKNIGTILKKPI